MDKRLKYNWVEIQEYYDSGHSYRDCIKKYGMHSLTLCKAMRRGDLKTRTATEGMRLRVKTCGPTCPKHTEESKKKIQEIVAEKVKNGTWHYSFSKVCTHEFDSKFVGKVKLMGRWELEYAKYLDNNNIEWRRPKEKFYYEFSGLKAGKGYYTPDFYLVKDNIYVEIKGYETDKDKAKWFWFPKDLKHKVLKRQDLLDLGLDLSDKQSITSDRKI